MARLIALTTLTMVAFAANSLLNRAALIDGGTGPAAFAALRVASGAVCLVLLVTIRRGFPKIGGDARVIGAGSLCVYILGFSFAYVALDAGIGALILFGMVQLTMFTGALLSGDRPGRARWIGAVVALLGLAWLVSPSAATAPDPAAAFLMALAGFGWGIYSLVGRRAADPLEETAANFICAAPVALLVWLVWADGITVSGALLAVLSGAVTSGLGYALWYSILPRLDASIAALAQLTVPVIAVAGGVILLSEPVTLRLLLASAVILGGVALGVLGQRRIGSKGS
ncbi:MAG: DMT family transporter [Pseudomonadota bacterium]